MTAPAEYQRTWKTEKATQCEESESDNALTLEINTMNWKKLKDNKCPKCDRLLKEEKHAYKCSSRTCDFLVSKSKFDSIIRNLYIQAERSQYRNIDEDENLSRLNEL